MVIDDDDDDDDCAASCGMSDWHVLAKKQKYSENATYLVTTNLT
jgi:hypothetical protein